MNTSSAIQPNRTSCQLNLPEQLLVKGWLLFRILLPVLSIEPVGTSPE